MNPRCPMVTLTAAETSRLKNLALSRGEKEAITMVGLRSAEAFFRAAAGFPIARLSAIAIRASLDRI